MPIGFHVGKNTRTMKQALIEDTKTITDFGLKPCVQIFTVGPQNYKETLTDSDKIFIKQYTRNVPLVIHGAYVDNPWGSSPGGTINIKKEMEICAQIGGTGVIVHLGAGATSDAILSHVLGEINTLSKNIKDSCILYLEINTAKKSSGTFETPDKINALFDRIEALGLDLQVGLCVDSAHVFSCGVSFEEYNFTMEWLNALPDVPIMFHLNDSASTLGSGKDKHEQLTKGNIWKDYGGDLLPIRDSGLMAILEWAQHNDIMVILERGDGLYEDLQLIDSLGYFKN